MSLPNIPNINPITGLEPEQVALLILASIALEEIGLAHVINAEGEKIQAALGTLVDENGDQVNPEVVATTFAELLEVNTSVEKTLRTIIKKEMLLQFKLEDTLAYLATLPPVTTTVTPTCDCSLSLDVTIEGNDIVQPTLPVVGPPGSDPTGSSTLDILVDICTGCSATFNAISWDYQRTPGSPQFRQQFTAETINVECTEVEGAIVSMILSGTGNAIGAGGGFTGQVEYVLVIDAITGIATLTLLNNGVVYLQAQPLGVEFTITPCPPVA